MTSPTTPAPTTPEPFPVEGALLAQQIAACFAAWKPRKRMGLAEWSAAHARLADGKRYRAFPFQKGIADALTQDGVTQVTVMKSARVGYSQIIQNYVAYSIHQRPKKVLIYQPTIDAAEKYSRDDLEPVLQWPAVRERVVFKPRTADNQVRAKRFPGGWVQIKGANSAGEFRRVTSDDVIVEEPDGIPPVVGLSGEPTDLAFMRCFTADDPLKVAGGTPLLAGSSRTERLFEQGTQEHRYVPCPHCGHMQRLVFGAPDGPGIKWEPKENPTRAWYQCAGEKACRIEEDDKAGMDERGEWRAHAPENGPAHRSFHIWAGYSQFDQASWLNIARQFLAVRKDPARFQTFVNEWLGETWKVKGEAPAWRRLYDRREDRQPGIVPREALILLAGIDVQHNRVEVFIWGWGADRQSWLVDHRVVPGNPYLAETWTGVTEIVSGEWQREGGAAMRLTRAAADIGFATTHVLAWARGNPLIVPVKGASSHHAPVFAWSDIRDPGPRGGKRKRGQRHGNVGGTLLTQELYGLLKLDPPTAEDAVQGVLHPPGFVHLPAGLATEEVCKQLVGLEWLEKSGEWKKVHADEALDGWKYARALFTALGFDRWTEAKWRELRLSWNDAETPSPPPRARASRPANPEAETTTAEPPRPARGRAGGWFNAPRRGYFGR